MRDQRLINQNYFYVNTRKQSDKDRKQRIKRNIQNRKNKLGIFNENIINSNEQAISNSSNIHCLNTHPQVSSTQQKNKMIQKLKNRQAAQKSRQDKKNYLKALQIKVKFLQEKIKNLQYCQECKKQLSINNNQLYFNQEMINLSQIGGETNQQVEIQEQSNFMRQHSTEGDSIGIYLFVFMIIIGIFCIGGRMETQESFHPHVRELTQTFSMQNIKLDSTNKFTSNMRSTYSTLHDSQLYNISQNAMMPIDQIQSRKHLSESEIQYYQNIISAFENHKLDSVQSKNLRSKLALIQNDKSLLFCDKPLIYKSKTVNSEGLLSTFIDIFVKGADIINIFSDSQIGMLDSGKIQYNGIYKISANVQEIQQIVNPKFIY